LRGGVKVLFKSGCMEDMVDATDRLDGAASVPAKPFDPATLGRAVRAALRTADEG
jgi:hypothetical protein